MQKRAHSRVLARFWLDLGLLDHHRNQSAGHQVPPGLQVDDFGLLDALGTLLLDSRCILDACKTVLTLAFWLDYGVLDALGTLLLDSRCILDSKWTPSELPDRLHVQLGSK